MDASEIYALWNIRKIYINLHSAIGPTENWEMLSSCMEPWQMNTYAHESNTSKGEGKPMV